jgi:glycosyltransferase involved in cell wall biosynthesis
MKTILLISPYWKEEHRWMVSTVKLAELWQRRGYIVHVLCMCSAGGTEKVSDTLTIHRVKDYFLPDPWNYGIAFGFAGKAARLARELKPDVIVVNKVLFWSSIALLRLRLAGHKVLLITDALVGITWWGRGRLFRICSAIYAWTLGWLILLAATQIVFFHPQPAAVLRRLRIDKKSTVIPTGIDPIPYAAGSQKGVASGQSVRVAYIGRLESVKGVDDFVAAALVVKKNYPDIQVKVVGWYKDGHPLVEQYKDQIEFTGLRKDIPEVLAQAEIFVMPSYSEGLSNALMEAMASGCACIATEVGGNAYLLQNGVSGFLFQPGDRAALESFITKLVGDPHKREAMGKAARERIEKLFSWDSVGQQYQRLFEGWTKADDQLRIDN